MVLRSARSAGAKQDRDGIKGKYMILINAAFTQLIARGRWSVAANVTEENR